MTRPALALLSLLAGLLGCEVIRDPCAGYELACLAVTVESGPQETHQLVVNVDDYTSDTVYTPRRPAPSPLAYPLRFAIRFLPFDRAYLGEVTIDVRALNQDAAEVIGQVRQTVKIDNKEKRRLSLRLGPPLPLDMTMTPDLRPAPDLSAADLAQDLADAAPHG